MSFYQSLDFGKGMIYLNGFTFTNTNQYLLSSRTLNFTEARKYCLAKYDSIQFHITKNK
ncbi:unnamed protein product [Schistosoma mattheei]|uniref:Uncharacterized protein n=1 Tax=Schistosoma mattheei TaxID=31246 RepID=A0A183NYK1_9TREM|nr:unnamed protein product [Schistosoma mattheei]